MAILNHLPFVVGPEIFGVGLFLVVGVCCLYVCVDEPPDGNWLTPFVHESAVSDTVSLIELPFISVIEMVIRERSVWVLPTPSSISNGKTVGSGRPSSLVPPPGM